MAKTLVIRAKLDLVLRRSEGLPTSLPVDSRVFRAQTGRLEETQVSLASVHSGGILEEEGELGSTTGTELEEETEIGVIGDNGIFSVT